MSTASLLMLLMHTVADDHSANNLMMYDAVIAVVLLAAAALFLFLEFLFVSYGLLSIAALGCAIAGIIIGFGSSPVVGWALVAATPVLAAAVTTWGLHRLMNSDLVPKDAITEDAGYRHACSEMGITSGSRGILITDAMPTGRARFSGGEIDVLVEGPVASTGTPITVRRIEGPTVLVVADATVPSSTPSSF
jgi:membrane-bound ClpP family serine protease